MIRPLSPRQEQIAKLICCGMSNGQIAGLCGISEQTVKNHVTQIFTRTGASNRMQVIIWGLYHGLVSVGDAYLLMTAVEVPPP